MAFTGKFEDGKLTITGQDTAYKKGGALAYNADEEYATDTTSFTAFGPEVTEIDASALNKAVGVQLTADGEALTKITSGKGNDVITLNETTAIKNIVTGEGNDELITTKTLEDEIDLIDMGKGNDVITGFKGNAKAIDLGDGNDDLSISTSGEAASVNGGAGNDIFTVLTGAKATIDGGAGNDTFEVYGDADASVKGGAGNDVFLIASTGTGKITIADYSDGVVDKTNGTDRIVFEGITADNIKLGDYDSETGIVKVTFTQGEGSVDVDLKVAAGSPINIYSDNTNGKGLTGAEKKASQAAYKTPVFSQMAITSDTTTYAITDSNTGNNLYLSSDKLTLVDASTVDDPTKTKPKALRSKAINIELASDNEDDTVEVIGSAKNDTIKVSGEASFEVTGGKGNDVYVITKGSTVTINDYDLNKDILYFDPSTGITSADDLKVTNVSTDPTESDTAVITANDGETKISIVGALWDGATKGKNLLVQFGTNKAEAFYAGNQDSAVVTALPKGSDNKVITAYDFYNIADTDTLLLGSNAVSGQKVNYTSDTNLVDFSKVNAKMTITAGAPAIVASKGNDTIIGGGDSSEGKTNSTVDGGAGNDYFIGGRAVNTFFGGVGNDTFRTGGNLENNTFTGGAGNDIILLTGRGVLQTITDYHNPTDKDYLKTTEGKAEKKDYGNDKIVISNDGYTKNQVAQAELITSRFDEDSNLYLGLVGREWDAEGGEYGTGDYVAANSLGLNASAVTFKNLDFSGKSQFDINYQGTSYKQTIESGTAVTATGNYLGYFNPNAKSITLNASAKASKLVGNSDTTTIVGAGKNDTLVYNSSSAGSLVGGAGNDVFDLRNSAIVTIADYNKEAKDKDIILVDDISALNVSYDENGKDLKVGDIVIQDGVGKAITFAQIDGQYTTKTDREGKTSITGIKNVQTTMVRTFTSDTTDAAATVVAGGASDYLQVFSEVDSAVEVVKAGSKATTMKIEGSSIKEVTGSGKADVIYVKNENTYDIDDDEVGFNYLTTVKTGGGNDTIDATSQGIEVTDFAKGTAQDKDNERKGIKAGDYKAGDILDFTGTNAPEIEDGKIKDAAFNGQHVQIGNVQLDNMKDQSIWVQYTSGTDTKLELVTLSNPHEFQIEDTANTKSKTIDASAATSDITIIDATKYTKGTVITAGKYVNEIYAGAGVDTIYATAGLNSEDNPLGVYIDSGNGADLIVFSSDVTTATNYVLANYTNDKIVLDDGMYIKGAGIFDGGYESTTKGTGARAVTTNYSDVTVAISDGEHDRTITLQKVANVGGAGFKINIQEGTEKSAPVQALEYGSSDITIANADGAVIDLTGAGLWIGEGEERVFKLNVELDAARSKAITINNAPTYTTVNASTGKGAAVTFIGASSGGANYIGGAKNDLYVGNGAADEVDFSAGGNNTVNGGNATVTFGTAKGNDSIVLSGGENMNITGFGVGGTDKILFDTDYTASLSDAAFDEENSKNLILTFRGVNAVDTDTVVMSTITLNDYDGEAISVNQMTLSNKKVKTTQQQALSFFSSDDESGVIDSVVGSASADWIAVRDDITTVTAGKGNDTISFEATSEDDYQTVTVTDFGTGTNVLKFAEEFSLTNYSADYIYDGGKDVTINSASGDVVLQGVGKKDKDNVATGKINYYDEEEKKVVGLALSNNVNITAAAANAKIDLTDMSFTQSYIATKYKAETDVKAGLGLTSYMAGTGADKLTTAVDVAYDDEEDTYYDRASQVEYTYVAQKANVADEIVLKQAFVTTEESDGDTEAVTAAPIKLSYGSLTYALGTDAKVGSNNITLNFKNGTKDAGSLKLTDGSSEGGVFTYTETVTLGTEADSDGKVSYTYSAKVTGAGLANVDITSKTGTVEVAENAENITIEGTTFTIGEDGVESVVTSSTGTSKSFIEKDFAETTALFDDFVTADVNELESITAKGYNEAAIVTDLTTDFTKSGNAFDVAAALATNKKQK